LTLIDEAVHSGCGISQAADAIGISERTYWRWHSQQKEVGKSEDRRQMAAHPTPANKLTESDEREILKVVNQPEFANDPPSQIVPKLADRGIYIASERTFYRVLKRHAQLKHRGRLKERKKKAVSTHIAKAPNRVWVWDITYLPFFPVQGMFLYLYMISDVFSRKIVAWEVWPVQTSENAAELVQRAAFAENLPFYPRLILHSDNGSPMKGFTLLAKLQDLGITPSYSRPRVSNDNAYAESLFRTVKYYPTYNPAGFKDIEEARQWCRQFVNWYNNVHCHSGINYYTPQQMHTGECWNAMEIRMKAYEDARSKHPERWNKRNIRDLRPPRTACLNPVNDCRKPHKGAGQHSAPPSVAPILSENTGQSKLSRPNEVSREAVALTAKMPVLYAPGGDGQGRVG
jgi:putative transposase